MNPFKALFKKLFFLPLIFCISQISQESRAQQVVSAYLKFDRITIADGLPANNIQAVTQDYLGFMWLGTQNGLSKYDGYEVQIYQKGVPDSLSVSGNFIQALCEDYENNLWVGTNSGLNLFDRSKNQFRHYKHEPNDKSSLPSNRITCIFEDSRKNIWVGTNDGLSKATISGSDVSFENYVYEPGNKNSLPGNNILCITEDKKGMLWIGTEDGLCRFDSKGKHFLRFRHDEDDPTSIPSNTVRTVCQDRKGIIWVGTTEGIARLRVSNQITGRFDDFPSEKHKGLQSDNIYVIHEDQDGWIWVGTSDGLHRLLESPQGNISFQAYTHSKSDLYSLSDNSIRVISEDKDGILWFGTYNGGINKLDKSKEKFSVYKRDPNSDNTLSNDVIRAFYEDENILWIGTQYGGLNKMTIKEGKTYFEYFRNNPKDPTSLSSDIVRTVFKDRRGNLWVGTNGGGLNRFNASTGGFKHYTHSDSRPSGLSNNSVYAIFEDRDGELWVSTAAGLDIFDYRTETFKHFTSGEAGGYKGGEVWHIYEDRDGLIWLASSNGLHVYDKEEKSFTDYYHEPNEKNSLSNNNVKCIYEDEFDNIWLGTNEGLNRFDKIRERFKYYGEEVGLPDNVVHGVLGDRRGNLWVSTNNGLTKFEIQSETFRNYDATDGLQNDEFTSGAFHRGKSGRLYFGGISGFNAFYPQQIKNNQYKPSVVITEFRLFNKRVEPGDEQDILNEHVNLAQEVRLDYDDRLFSFEFAALQYSDPKKNLYAFRMEGFDEDWTYTGAAQRNATYTNLPPGEYVFNVKGANSDGVWGYEEAKIKVVISTPLWHSWWFRIGAFFAVALVILLIYRSATTFRENRTLRSKIDEEEDMLQRYGSEIKALREEVDKRTMYAKHLQEAILSTPDRVRKILPDSFVFHRARHIINADLLWYARKDNDIFIASVDCSGHDTSAAFTSLLVDSYLNQIVKERGITEPHTILDELHESIKYIIRKSDKYADSKIEIGLCVIKRREKVLEFAGAKSPMIYIKGQELKVVKGDRVSIGELWASSDAPKRFTKHTISLREPTVIYLFTDGYHSQFGGEDDKKLKVKGFKELLSNIHLKPVHDQRRLLEEKHDEWRKNNEQLDDILVFGMKF